MELPEAKTDNIQKKQGWLFLIKYIYWDNKEEQFQK